MKTAIMFVMAMVIATGGWYGEATGQPPPVPSEEQPEVLTRGPVNEAFAQPVNLENQPGLVAPSAPPVDIAEAPPEERPVGEQFAWVPGYWAWDSDKNDYIWVSGCWRAVPPGMKWVPGYWLQTAGGWQWVAGFWAPAGDKELAYLPEPPELTGIAAPGPAPSADKIWVPPCWYWYHGQYVWRPGYWTVAQADWVWVPSHYIRTPRGYVFAKGYWDYPLGRRGVLFAPVYFPHHIHARPGFSYALSIVVDLGNLEFGLFTRPQYSHYYFGDYYDSLYIGIGIFPWFEWEQRRTWYDPIYVHDRWRHRQDKARWEQRERREYDRRRADKALRPPRTYHEMESRMKKSPASQRKNFQLSEPISRTVARKKTTFKFETIKPQARRQLLKNSSDLHKFVKERSHWESQRPGRNSDRPATTRVAPSQRTERPSPRKEPERNAVEPGKPAPEEHRRYDEGTPERTAVEPGKSAPAEHRRHDEAAPGRNRENETTVNGPQRPAKVLSREAQPDQPDRVRVRTPPEPGRQRGRSSRKKPPSRPSEEQNDHR